MSQKLLLANYDKRWGGGQEYLVYLIEGLLKQNFQIGQLIEPSSISAERFLEKFKHEPNYKPYIISRKNLFELKKIISQYSILHIHREHDIWLSLLANLKTKKVFSQHIKPNKKRLFMPLFQKIICNSNYVKSAFEKIYKREAHLIFPSICLKENNLPNKIILQGKPKILMSAAFHKNQIELIEIFELIEKKMPEAMLYFIGPSAETKALNNLKNLINIKNLNQKITILPSCKHSQYLEILKQIDVFAYTYTEEAFGMAVLEAALMNKNIIAYKGGGLIDVLENYTKAILIEPNNKMAFAYALTQLENLPIINLETLKQKFSKEQLVEKHLKIYKKSY